MHESGETGLTHVLAVDDDPSVRDLITTYLGDYDMRVTAVPDEREMSKVLTREAVDLVLLDLRLKGEDGMDIARKLRATSKLPIIILTGRQDDADRVMGLELGADDYLTKPFELRELVLRLRALDRRRQRVRPPVLEVAGLRLDPFRREVFRDGRYVALTRKQFAVLEVLIDADGGVVSAEQLLERAWDENADPFTNAVRITVSSLRKRLGEPWLILTVPGVGYRIGTDADA
jgi:two-component system response regulator VanR